MKMVYTAHPYNGEVENVAKIEKIIKDLLKWYPDTSFYSPLHATGFLYDDVSYIDGMAHCFEALGRCDELWLCEGWENSRGCNMEYAYAKGRNMPIRFVYLDAISKIYYATGKEITG